jgi:hypothetical protein
MRGSPRILVQGFLVGTMLATQTGVVAAQIPNPVDSATGLLPTPTPIPTIEEVIQDAVDIVGDTVDAADETVDDTTDTAGKTTDPVESTTKAGSTDSVKDTAASASKTVDTVTGGGSQPGAGGTTGTTATGGAAGSGATTSRSLTSTSTSVSLQNWVKARGLFNSAALLSGAQPSLAILVDAMNDADGDGIFSDNESAPTPRSDVAFKALITNIGSTNFEIAGLTHSYSGAPSQGKVCAELVGIMLAPGESLACSFPVADYAPPPGDSVVNTLMAAAFEVGKGARRGASDSDTTTVGTVLAGDEVLAVAIKRNLAFTGTEAARLLALALVLLASGGGLISLARARARRPASRRQAEPAAESLGWWTKPPSTTRSKEKAHSKL